jgi:hypothetical protein
MTHPFDEGFEADKGGKLARKFIPPQPAAALKTIPVWPVGYIGIVPSLLLP